MTLTNKYFSGEHNFSTIFQKLFFNVAVFLCSFMETQHFSNLYIDRLFSMLKHLIVFLYCFRNATV